MTNPTATVLASPNLVARTPHTDWVALAHEIGPRLAATARQHDNAGSFVRDAYDVLTRHRFFSLGIPPELGGGGASYTELCNTIRTLAHYCSSTALAFSMHAHLVAATVWKHKRGQPGEKLLRKVADAQTVLLSTGASDWVDSNGTMERVDGGYRVTARKIFGSGSVAAHLAIASAVYDDPHEGEQVLHFPVPMNAEGVRIQSDWNALGMRGTGSNTVIFDRVFVPDEAIALRRPRGMWHPAWSVVITVAAPIYMAAYVGTAEAAADEALALARRSAPTPISPLSVGEMQNQLFLVRCLWDRMVANAAEYEFAPELGRVTDALTGKTLVANACIATVEKAMEVVGGRGYFRDNSLEQRLRDIHGAPYHPLPEKRQLHFCGLFALGRDPIAGELL